MKSQRHIQYYALIISICIVATGLFLGWNAANYLAANIMDRELRVASRFIEKTVAEELSIAELHDIDNVNSRKKLAAVGLQLLAMPEALRVKIFDTTGTVAWSNQAKLIGRRNARDSALQQSLRGEAVILLDPISPIAEYFAGAEKYPQPARLYVPIFDPASQRTVAVVELNKVPDFLLLSIYQGQIALWLMILGCSSLLLLTQLLFLRRTGSKIEHYIIELQLQAAALRSKKIQVEETPRKPLGFSGDDEERKLTTTIFSFAELINDTVASLKQDPSRAGVDTRITSSRKDDQLKWDRVKMTDAIHELLRLGFKAGAKTIWIDSRDSRTDGRPTVDITIDDDGTGTRSETKEKQTSGGSLTQRIELGEARRIIEAHGGSVTIKPREGGGTSVGLNLPMVVMRGVISSHPSDFLRNTGTTGAGA